MFFKRFVFFNVVLVTSFFGHNIASHPESFEKENKTQIIQGEPIPEGKYPFVAILLSDKGNFCGASIISQYYLMTAADCIRNEDGTPMREYEFRVGVGSAFRDRLEFHNVDEVRAHSEFRKIQLTDGFDIALVKLTRPLKLEKGRVETIALPEQNELVPKKLVSVGWSKATLGSSQSQLYGTEIGILDFKTCSGLMRHQFTDNIFCNEDNEKTSCYVS